MHFATNCEHRDMHLPVQGSYCTWHTATAGRIMCGSVPSFESIADIRLHRFSFSPQVPTTFVSAGHLIIITAVTGMHICMFSCLNAVTPASRTLDNASIWGGRGGRGRAGRGGAGAGQ